MPKRKYDHYDLDLTVTHFLVKTPVRNHQEAIELLIAQYVDLLSKTTRAAQIEHIIGMNEFLKEVENGTV